MSPPALLPVPETALAWAKELLGDAQKRKELCYREFEAADEDGSGSLDIAEVRDLIFKVCKAMGIRMPREERVVELVHKVDKDNSGELDVKEFATAFKVVLQSCVHEAEVEAVERAEKVKLPELEKNPQEKNEIALPEKNEAELPELEKNPQELQKEPEEPLELAEEKTHVSDPTEQAELQAHIVTDLMIAEKMQAGLDQDLQERVQTRAYFLWLNGSPKSSDENYCDALRAELEHFMLASPEAVLA